MRWSKTATLLLAGVCLFSLVALKLRGTSAHSATLATGGQQQAPRQRQEFRHRTHETENTRTYTFVDDEVRKVEIRFADGALGYRLLDGKTADGKPRLTACEEIHEDKTRYAFGFGEDGSISSTTAYNKKGLVAYKEINGLGKVNRTFLAEDGQTKLATLELLKEGGYTFVAYTGAAGSERKLYQEQYTEYREDEEGPSTAVVTTYTVWDGGRKPQYRQIWLRDLQGANYARLDRLEYFRDGGAQVAARISVAQDGTAIVRILDNAENVTSIRNLSADGRLISVTDPTKTPAETFLMPPDSAMKEAIAPAHLSKPANEAMKKLLADALLSGPGYLHLERLLVE